MPESFAQRSDPPRRIAYAPGFPVVASHLPTGMDPVVEGIYSLFPEFDTNTLCRVILR